MKFGTKAIHAGVHPDEATGAIMTPIYQTSTYVQESPGVNNNPFLITRTLFAYGNDMPIALVNAYDVLEPSVSSGCDRTTLIV